MVIMKKGNNCNEEKEQTLKNHQHFFREIEIEFLIHELKSPISVIEAGVRMLLERKEKYGSLTSLQEKILKRAYRNSKKVGEMLNNLLEIGRSEEGCFICCRFKPAEAAYDVLIDALETTEATIFEQIGKYTGKSETLEFLSGGGIFLDISAQVVQTEMFQDEIKFRQITGNLIKNALYHRKERIEIKMKQEKDNLLIEVTDDGPGIEPEHHQMVFQLYMQANEYSVSPRKGHGLGLAGALILARCLGGDIELESEKGRGATFKLLIPIILERGKVS